jgi:signal transduction histidine kinase
MGDIQIDYKAELEELKKEYSNFIYIVSHDIKAPLRAISNLTTWIEEDLGSDAAEDVQNNFKLLKNRVSRLESMMNALLEVSRVSSLEMEFYEVNLPKLVDDSIQIIKEKQNVEFHFNYDLNKESFQTLGKKLQKVLFNLLDNAVRFNDKEKGNVFIEIIEKETEYEIKIIDDGPGINDQVSDKIFNIFYTVNSKDVLETIGAGLTISKKIVKMVGGKIEYFPAENNGSVFIVNWPKTIILKI